jgi:hypothetical protein
MVFKFSPLLLGSLLAIILNLISSHVFAQETFQASVEGFYPIWESTGYVQQHRRGYIGTNGADFGIKDVAQIGIQPILYLYRSPNAYVKFSVFEKEGWHVAGQVGAYHLFDQASRAFFSPMYSSRLDNPDFNVLLLPVSAIATKEVSDWLQIHQTLTAKMIYSSNGSLSNQVALGYSVVTELKALTNHSLLLHATEVGFWNHDIFILGTSYRYHNSWLELRLGYFYRLVPGALQTAPLLGVGFKL